jgi:hypothetical protein
MGSTRIRALTGRRRPCGGLRAIPMSRSGRATSCQPPLRRPESERPGRLGAISLSKTGREGCRDIPEKPDPPATLPGKTYPYMPRVLFQGRTAVRAWYVPR